MTSNITGITRRSLWRWFLHGTVKEAPLQSRCFILQLENHFQGVQWRKNDGWLIGHVAVGIPLDWGLFVCAINDRDFQQGNAAVHNAFLTKDFFQKNNVTLLNLHTCSPDLNSVENISVGTAWKNCVEPSRLCRKTIGLSGIPLETAA